MILSCLFLRFAFCYVLCMSIPGCSQVRVSTGTHGGQKRMLDPRELKAQAAVGLLTRTLGSARWAFVRVLCLPGPRRARDSSHLLPESSAPLDTFISLFLPKASVFCGASTVLLPTSSQLLHLVNWPHTLHPYSVGHTSGSPAGC